VTAPVILCPPVGADVPAVIAAFDGGVPIQPELSPADVRSAILVQAATSFVDDLMGDDLLAERGQAWGVTDPRSVGEVLARTIDYADLAVTCGASTIVSDHLLEHLAARRRRSVTAVAALDAREIATNGRDAAARDRVNPLTIASPSVPDTEHAWTLALESWRPVHPQHFRHRRS
jgi:hypothetical protein